MNSCLVTLGQLDGTDRDGPAAFDAIAKDRNLRVVSYPDWKIIDRLETEAAENGAPRKKFLTPAAMIEALDGASA